MLLSYWLILLFSGNCITALTLGDKLSSDPCSANETFALTCASMKESCEDQCYDLYKRPIATDPSCSSNCLRRTPTCLCKPAYYRLDGRCVYKEECPKQCKEANEIKVSCDQPIDPRCQPSCRDPFRDRNSQLVVGVPAFYCTWGFCEILACACKEGFVRGDVHLKCIPKEEC